MDSLPFTYFLPLLLFELFFLYLAIVRKNAFEKQLTPSKVTEVNWNYGKYSIFVLLKTPKRVSIILPQGGFRYFLQIIEQYTELKFYYK